MNTAARSFAATLVVLLGVCPSATTAQECTLCARAGDVPNLSPPPSVFDPQDQVDCTELDSDRAQFNDDTPECTSIQLAAFQGGCCQFPPYEKCSICPTGEDPPGRDNVVPTPGASQPSCSEFVFIDGAYVTVGNVGSCDDIYLRRLSFFCDCPGVQQECGLCPAHEDEDFPQPSRASRRDNILRQESCRGIHFNTVVLDADQCPDQEQVYGVDYAAFCGCPGVNVTDSSCSVCEDGQRARSGDTVAYTEEGPDGVTRDITCSEADELASFVTSDSTCSQIVEKTREACCSASDVLRTLGSMAVVALSVFGLLLV